MHCYRALQRGTAKEKVIADLILLAFYYLLCPGEYSVGGTDCDSTPFKVQDATVYENARPIPFGHKRWEDVNFSQLYFTTQKNSMKGESMEHGLSGHAYACPTRTTQRLLTRLHQNNARKSTPLCAYKEGHQGKLVRSTDITTALRTSVAAIGAKFGLKPRDISALSLRASEAMALLLGNVDKNTIKMVGRWRSDEMMRYLHISARQLIHKHAATMYENSDYTLMAPPTQQGL